MVTFAVSDVKRENSPLPTAATRRQLAMLGWRTPEAYRISAGELIHGYAVNPLALAVHLAFAHHRPLVLTPDAVWLCLVQGLATHIDLNAEVLRPRLVRHTGKLELVERRDDFVPGRPDNNWPAVIDGLVAQIRQHLGGRADAFVADFSTTGPLERTASQIALMSAMKQYFDYMLMTRCGIPEITLAGTPDDWASIRRRLAALAEFDLAWWVDHLDPVLAKIEATARGTIDREFWRRLYKLEDQSGGPYAFGWLNVLFPYVDDPPVRNSFPSIDDGPFSGSKLDSFPSGRTRVPFTWQILDQRFAMELVGGLWGVTQDAGGALGVATGWLVDRPRGEYARIVDSDFDYEPRHGSEPASISCSGSGSGGALESLASLEAEASDEPTALCLRDMPRLRSLDGVQHLRGLIAVDLEDMPELEDITALAGMTSLKRLELGECPQLAGLGAVLEMLPQLEGFYLSSIPRLTLDDLRPLARMPRLSSVQLWYCPDLLERCIFQTPDAIAALKAELARRR